MTISLRKIGRSFRRKPSYESKFKRGRNLHMEALERRDLLAAEGLVIAEFMASNDGALQDQFGLSSDWIEIFNPTEAPVSLAGWHLTDDVETKDKWTFPEATIEAGQFMVVFASGEDVKDTGGPLHTSFRLNADGEYLGLIRPDMTVAHDFAETYPRQFADVSYGLAATAAPVLDGAPPVSYHVPSVGDAPLVANADWAQLGFDASAWSKADNSSITQGVGYAISDSAAELAGQFTADVQNDIFLKNASLWVRQEFEVADPTTIDGLLLDIQYDDGFVAYINGVEVVRSNTPEGDATWDWAAELPRRWSRNHDQLVPDRFDVGEHTGALVAGTNLLAIHALNEKSFDEELLSRATLTSITVPSDPAQAVLGYMVLATPGSANRELRGGSVEFTESSKMFTDPFMLEITALNEGDVVRYTTDGSDPDANSTAYTGPVEVTQSATIRAAAFPAVGDSGPVTVRSFVQLGDDIGGFSSNLPLVVFSSPISRVHTSTVSETVDVNSFMTVFEPDETGRTTISTDPVVATQSAIRRRGSSTSGNQKLNLAVETRDDSGSDQAVELVGMAADADWVFYAPYNFDRTKGIRNSFFYEIANQIGPWASATRFVEVFHNVDGDALTEDDYQGIYVIVEKIQRGENRVDIQKLGPDDIAEPEVTGGWIWKVDRADQGDSGFSAGGQSIKWVNPKEEEVELVPEQVEWAKDYFNNMRDVFRDADATWEQITDIIGVESWIDHAIVNTMTFNLDAYRLSGYFYKDRGGKLEMGPIWDCDRCMGSEDSRDNDPEVWHSRVSDYGTDFFGYPWWGDLYLNQPNFWQAWIDRWFELRQEQMSDENIASIVDKFAAQLEESTPRDIDKWNQRPTGSNNYAPEELRRTSEGEVLHLKGFNQVRVDWIDARFVQPVTITPGDGKLVPGQQVTMSAAAGKIYYTTDGTDPRASGGAVAAGALVYEGPITVNAAATIMARAFDDSEPVELNPNRTHNDPRSGSFWSAPATVNLAEDNFANESNLRITEVNYNPPEASPQELEKLGGDFVQNGIDSSEFEFLELMNISDQPINLNGAELIKVSAFDRMQGVEFVFGDQMLNPGERIIVAENVAAFRARFGDSARIADGNSGVADATKGQYAGLLNNAGETLKLVDRFSNTIQRFGYEANQNWPQRSDGRGSSLEIVDATGNYSDPANWRDSANFGGSPGTGGLEQANTVVVSEVLPNSSQAPGDRLELQNTTASPIDITHWFISNSADEFRKFQVTTPTTIPAGGYVVFTEEQLGFSFDGARGDDVFVVEGDPSGRLLRFVHETSFPNAALNVSLAPRPDNADPSLPAFLPLTSATWGSANSGVRTGDVLISEIHYSPLDPDGAGRQDPDDMEFMELFNQTGGPVDLGGWRLTGDGVSMEFAEGTTLAAGESMALVPFDPAAGNDGLVFKFFYNVANDVQLAGDFREGRRDSLNDEGAHLLLERPGVPPADDPGFTPYIWVDELTYDDAVPWATDLAGNGNSLTRVAAEQPGYLPTNWIAKPASPGTVEFIVRPSGDANEDGTFDENDLISVLQSGKYLSEDPATFADGDWNGDGLFNQLDIVLAMQTGNFAGISFTALRPEANTASTALRSVTPPGQADDVFAELDELFGEDVDWAR